MDSGNDDKATQQIIDVPEELKSIGNEYDGQCQGTFLCEEDRIKSFLPSQFAKYFVGIGDVEWLDIPLHIAASVKIPGLAKIQCILNIGCGCILGYMADVDEYVPKWKCEDAPTSWIYRTPQEVIDRARYIYMTRFRHKNE